MTSPYVKFEGFAGDIGKKIQDLQAAGDTLKVYLTNNTPDVAADTVKADLAGITEENGYAPADVQNGYTETAGVGTLTGVDVVWTATAGGFGPFRYVVLYNDTPTSPADPLIAYWDYGSSISITEDVPFTVDFPAGVIFTLT
jgi:hypothetical protein